MHLVIAIFVLLLSGVFASGAPCVVDTLDNYLGTDCEIGLFQFKNFTFDVTPSGGATPASASQITVIPTLTPDQMILRFESAHFFVSGTEREVYEISYVVDPPPIIFRFDDEMATLTPVAPGRVDIFTNVCANGAGAPPCPPGTIVNLHVFHDGIAPQLVDVALLPLSNYLEVTNTIDLQANGASADFHSFQNKIYYIPEPASMLLAGGALSLLTIMQLVRRSRRNC